MKRIVIVGLISVPLVALAVGTEIVSSDAPSLVQWLINALFTITGIFGGWVLSTMQRNLRDLQMADTVLAEKVHIIDVLVAGQYVKKDELEKLSFALFSKLDRIESKLDQKADKL